MEKSFNATLADRKEVAEDTYEVTFEIDSNIFSFVPGQYVWVILTELKYSDERGNRRAFSIVSNFKDGANRIGCTFRKSNSGFKKTLISMPIGSMVKIEGPFGFCTLPQKETVPVVFLVGGVGIASVLTMVSHATTNKSPRRIILIYANDSPKRTAYLGELEELQRENKNFILVPHFGNLNQEIIFSNTKGLVDPVWYIFGPEAMVSEIGEMLDKNNIQQDRIETEEFGLRISRAYKKNKKVIETNDGLRMALNGAFNHIILTDSEGVIVYANHGAEIITGYNIEEMIGSTPRLWGGLMDNDFYKSLWKTIKEDRKTFEGEVNNRKKSGEGYIAQVKISPILNKKNKDLLGFVGTEEDITKEKEVDRAKSEFVSLASHQLRTPPSIIGWYTETLQSGDLGPINKKQADYLEEIYRANQRMIAVINSLLNISRIEMGTFLISPKKIEIKNIIDETINELASRFNRKIEAKKDYDPALSSFNADPNIIQIIIDNLLSNAIKYSPPENTKIEIAVKMENGFLLLSIKDNGIGIPLKDRGRVFEKLFRADNAVSANPDGTGLGLYMIKKIIVDGLGGKIWFDSEENKGTTFYVSIPASGMKEKPGTTTLAPVSR